jgi:hypothetical protein
MYEDIHFPKELQLSFISCGSEPIHTPTSEAKSTKPGLAFSAHPTKPNDGHIAIHLVSGSLSFRLEAVWSSP